MKPSFLLTVFVISCLQIFAQQDTALSFVEDAIRSRKDVRKIVYLDSSITFYQPFRHFIRSGKVEGFKGQAKTSMTFTAKEVRSIDKAFQRVGVVGWHDTLFANSVRVNQDTLLLLSKDANSNAYFKQQFANKYFLFSEPVFVRNGNVAIFRVAEMFGHSAGNDLLYIYSKEQGKWEQQMLIYAGAW